MSKQHIPEKMFRVGAAWPSVNYEMSFTEIDENRDVKVKRRVRRKVDKLARQIDIEVNKILDENKKNRRKK